MVTREVEVIHSWSAPRSFSTSLMYYFAQRDDIEVLDEPLYANFLRVTGAERPYRDKVLSKMDSDGNRVVKEVIYAPGEKKFRYCKPSFDKVVPPSFLELGLGDLVSIYSELCELLNPPPVIDSEDLLQDPEVGSWSKTSSWYTVYGLRGGMEVCISRQPFPLAQYDLLEQSLHFYNMLRRHKRKTLSSLGPSLPTPSLPVPANEKLLVWVGDELFPRESAKVSVFDSIVQGGDAVWEGLRIYDGKIFKLNEHLDRLFDSAKALAFSNVPNREEVKDAIFKTLIVNGMFDNAHIRLTLSRGQKCLLNGSHQSDNSRGITLVTATTRRNSPNCIDSKIHHNNLINNILAKVEGNFAKADDAIMLDQDDFVSETNATNIFLVKKGKVSTPHADYCLPGITRATVMELVIQENLVLHERRISLSEFHAADEVWTTGTMGELTPVTTIDGRVIGNGQVGPVTGRIQNAYKVLTEESGIPIPRHVEA